MLVDSPLSCIMLVVGAPTRDFWSFSLESNARHSGPGSISSSSTTRPQSSQTVSPRSLSESNEPPHSGQTSDSSSSVCSSSVSRSLVYRRMVVSVIGWANGRVWGPEKLSCNLLLWPEQLKTFPKSQSYDFYIEKHYSLL